MTTNVKTASPADQGRRNRRWSNLLLNRRFQLKYTGMIVGVSIIISTLLGSFLIEKMRENSRMLQLEAELDELFQAELASQDAQIVLAMVGALLAFNVVLGIMAVFVTHRMAGPIFVVKRYVRVLGEGRIPELRRLRRGDEFRDLLEVLQDSVRSIEARTKEEVDALHRAMVAMDKQDLDSAKNELSALLKTKRLVIAPDEQTIDVEE